MPIAMAGQVVMGWAQARKTQVTENADLVHICQRQLRKCRKIFMLEPLQHFSGRKAGLFILSHTT